MSKGSCPSYPFVPFVFFNDEPVGRGETAYFQFEHYADTFARIIAARDTRTPLTIGVHGD